MKTTQPILIAVLAVAIAGAVASVVIAKRQAARDATRAAAHEAKLERARNQARLVPAQEPASMAPEPLRSEEITGSPESTPTVQPVKSDTQTTAKPQKTADQVQPTKQPKEEIKDPLARVALSFVGADPGTDDYWIGAINDPSLSAHERQDLIEDLNEDGISDPRHPGMDDLPLIATRIQLIEELAPYAMDQVNADAFEEAYKDLVNMVNGKSPQ
jgi:hypothetical protein